jgi:hypothetical protein
MSGTAANGIAHELTTYGTGSDEEITITKKEIIRPYSDEYISEEDSLQHIIDNHSRFITDRNYEILKLLEGIKKENPDEITEEKINKYKKIAEQYNEKIIRREKDADFNKIIITNSDLEEKLDEYKTNYDQVITKLNELEKSKHTDEPKPPIEWFKILGIAFLALMAIFPIIMQIRAKIMVKRQQETLRKEQELQQKQQQLNDALENTDIDEIGNKY